jgi:hypothetical protein
VPGARVLYTVTIGCGILRGATLALSLGTPGNAPSASMPAAARLSARQPEEFELEVENAGVCFRPVPLVN